MNDTVNTATLPRQRTPIAITVDNLLRRKLRIGNPRDPREVAEGLRRIFPAERQAQLRETSGLPIVSVPQPVAASASGGPSSVELVQATDDVERDLKALMSNSQLKDIEAELEGWGQAIRSIIAEGTSAARLALDPRARDRVFGARRQLGDYARMARLIGAMTPTLSPMYRRLAQSLDEMSAVMLVLLGEALASLGLGSGRVLLSVPAGELSSRRDAVLHALRNLTGATDNTLNQTSWPYGLHGLRLVLQRLETSGHADLRALLDENTLAQTLDDLVDRAASPTPRGLRALSATSQVTLQRLQRLIAIITSVVGNGESDSDSESPAVISFLSALQLLIDGFNTGSSGYRLLFIARPPIAYYGLYGIGALDLATRRLIDVVQLRGRLAEMLDCYLGCECCGDEVVCQVILDKLLYGTDRAIDLLALGVDVTGKGEPEQRAGAYGWLIEQFLQYEAKHNGTCLTKNCATSSVQTDGSTQSHNELQDVLQCLALNLLEPHVTPAQALEGKPEEWPDREVMRAELCMQAQMEKQWHSLVASMTPSCTSWVTVAERVAGLLKLAEEGLGYKDECQAPNLAPPPTIETSLSSIAHLRLPNGRTTFTRAEWELIRDRNRTHAANIFPGIKP